MQNCFHSSLLLLQLLVILNPLVKWRSASAGTELLVSAGLTARTDGSPHREKRFYQNFVLRLSKILVFIKQIIKWEGLYSQIPIFIALYLNIN